jgi:hypothetical protein
MIYFFVIRIHLTRTHTSACHNIIHNNTYKLFDTHRYRIICLALKVVL